VIGPNDDPFVYYKVPVELSLQVTAKYGLPKDFTIVVKEQANDPPLLHYAGTATVNANANSAGMIRLDTRSNATVLIPWHRAKRIMTNEFGTSAVTTVDGSTYSGRVYTIVRDENGDRHSISACGTVTVTTATSTVVPDKQTAPECQFSIEDEYSIKALTISFTGRDAHFVSENRDRPHSFTDRGANYSLKVGDKTVTGSLADCQTVTLRGNYGMALVLRSGEKVQGKLVAPPDVKGQKWALVFQTDDGCVVVVKL
jgi:hypothetical protein